MSFDPELSYLETICKLENQIKQLNQMLDEKEQVFEVPVPDYGFVEMNDYGEPVAIYLSETDIPEGTKAFMIKITK